MENKSGWRTEPISCVICRTRFFRTHWGQRHCSAGCVRNHHTKIHAEYVAKNRQTIRRYANERRYALWGKSDIQTARMAEELAVAQILPALGFVGLVDIAACRRLVPFDVVGMLEGKMALVDVTTSLYKGGRRLEFAVQLANALGMRLYILFVKPDLRYYAIRRAGQGGIYCRQSELREVEN